MYRPRLVDRQNTPQRPTPPPAVDAAAVRARAIEHACATYGIRRLVSFGEIKSENGAAYELFYEAKGSGGYTNRAFTRYRHDPATLHPQFDTTPAPTPEPLGTLPTAQAWLNRNAPTRHEPPPEPISGIGDTTPAAW